MVEGEKEERQSMAAVKMISRELMSRRSYGEKS